MKTSDKGIDLIKRFEGYEEKAYRCPAGVLTIGYGHTGGVYEGQVCTREQAERWLREDLRSAENAVNALEPARPLRQCEFDALVSFVYNLGQGNFRDSTLRRKVLANPDNPTIRDEFRRWVYADGRMLPGLVARREAEADLYFSDM